jgi:hypothetical protein
MRLSLFAVMLCAGLAQAQTVTMPKDLTGLAGDLLPFSLSHDGDDVTWFSTEGITVFREYSNSPKDIFLRVHGRKPGNFIIFAVSSKAVEGKSKNGSVAICKVTLQSDVPVPPTPPTPNPNPGPNPPTPPGPPTPNPGPLPSDPVSLRLIAAWQKDRAGKSDSERNALEEAAKRSLKSTVTGWFSSMPDTFKEPHGMRKQLNKAEELFHKSFSSNEQDFLDIVKIEAYLQELNKIIGKTAGQSDYKNDRLNSEERKKQNLDLSKRQYNKLFRHLGRLEAKLRTVMREQQKLRFTKISKASLASLIVKTFHYVVLYSALKEENSQGVGPKVEVRSIHSIVLKSKALTITETSLKRLLWLIWTSSSLIRSIYRNYKKNSKRNLERLQLTSRRTQESYERTLMNFVNARMYLLRKTLMGLLVITS